MVSVHQFYSRWPHRPPCLFGPLSYTVGPLISPSWMVSDRPRLPPQPARSLLRALPPIVQRSSSSDSGKLSSRSALLLEESPALKKAVDQGHHYVFLHSAERMEQVENTDDSQEEWAWREDISEAMDAYEATELAHEEEDLQTIADLQALRAGLGEEYRAGLTRFLPRTTARGKVDLSYTNVMAWERGLGQLETSAATRSFRSNTPLRRMMLSYMVKVEPIFNTPAVGGRVAHDRLIDDALLSVFTDSELRNLSRARYDAADVACWSWVFVAPSVRLAFWRYSLLADNWRIQQPDRRLPKFIILQLLRSGSISASDLQRLVESLLADLQVCKERELYNEWHWKTRVTLVVRLLRHARQVDPDRLEDITQIIRHLFVDFYDVLSEKPREWELEKLAQIFNRFLSLMSLATVSRSFNSSLKQQNAQLALVRMMVAFKPQIPVTREGYRALIKVQLLHKKTTEERSWAQAKSLSWPPWRHDKLGIEEDLEYPGKESRALRLLRRMKEAGYAHGPWEQTASVLAGWDTDKSPTIQFRSILRRATRPWLLGNDKSDEAEAIKHDLWAARIRSTRSKLEAWAAFSAYAKSTPVPQRQFRPYYAMLEKLMTQTVSLHSVLGSRYLPGDIKENFPDPINPNQMVYVEQPVPTTDQFYGMMLHDGFQPAGAMLCSLLESASSLEAGLRYIAQSKWDEVTRDVLLHAERYPLTLVQNILSNLPPRFLAAFAGLLCRYGFESKPPLYEPCSLTSGTSHDNGDSAVPRNPETRPLIYAHRMLLSSGFNGITSWNGYLKGLALCIADSRKRARDGTISAGTAIAMKVAVWRRVENVFVPKRLQELELYPDFTTFRTTAWLTELLLDDNQFHFPRASHLVNVTKSLFVNAAYGQNSATWPGSAIAAPPLITPEPSDIRQLVRLMVSAHEVKGLIVVLKWVNHHLDTFKPMTLYSESDPDELPHLRGTLCAIRLFLEGSKGLSSTTSPVDDGLWFDTPLEVKDRDLAQAREECQPLGWPTDDETNLFLSQNEAWIAKVAKAADVTSTKEAKRLDKIARKEKKGPEQDP